MEIASNAWNAPLTNGNAVLLVFWLTFTIGLAAKTIVSAVNNLLERLIKLNDWNEMRGR